MLRPDGEILVPIGAGPWPERALRLAAAVRGRFGGRLRVLSVLDAVAELPMHAAVSDPFILDVRADAVRGPIAERLREELPHGGREADVAVRFGHPVDEILAEARDRSAGLIVVGTHDRRGLARLLSGSVAWELIRGAPCPVLALPETGDRVAEERLRLRRILVATDLLPASQRAVDEALQLASATGAELHLVRVVPDDVPTEGWLGGAVAGAPRDRDQVFDAWRELARYRLETARRAEPGVTVRSFVRRGKPAAAIAECAEREDVDLVIAGTTRRRGLARMLFGSVAESIVCNARCPVLVLPEGADGLLAGPRGTATRPISASARERAACAAPRDRRAAPGRSRRESTTQRRRRERTTAPRRTDPGHRAR